MTSARGFIGLATAILSVAGTCLVVAASPVRAQSWETVGPPTDRFGAASAYDPLRRRMLVFGGDADGNRNDVWAYHFTSNSWTNLAPAGSPPSPRRGSSVVYDSFRDVLWVIGGNDGVPRNDVWKLTLSGTPAWTAIAAGGDTLPAADRRAAAFDTHRDRIFVFGGLSASGALGDGYVLDLSATAWHRLPRPVVRPTARIGASATFVADQDRMVLLGGAPTVAMIPNSESWALAMGADSVWTPLPAMPHGRSEHAAILVPAGNALFVLGGLPASLLSSFDVLSLNGTPGWTTFGAAGATATISEGVAAYDAVSGRLAYAGGETPRRGGGVHTALIGFGPPYSWGSPLTPPTARRLAGLSADAGRDRVVLFGGINGASDFFNPNYAIAETYTLGLAPGSTWKLLLREGGAPPPRDSHVQAYDPVADQMLVAFGRAPSGSALNDTWLLQFSGSAASWIPLATSPVAARAGTYSVFDSRRRRAVVFGGKVNGVESNEVLTFDFANPSSWQTLATTGAPLPRRDGVAVYDSLEDRMLVIGGVVNDGGSTSATSDVWELRFSGTPTWSLLAPTGIVAPSVVDGATASFDPVHRRVDCVTGGGAFALELTGAAHWSSMSLPADWASGRSGVSSVWDANRNRFVVFGGGSSPDTPTADLWAFSLPEPAGVPHAPRSGGGIEVRSGPNPFVRSIAFDVRLPGAAALRAEVLDLAGRRVRVIDDGAVVALEHRLAWDGRDDSGARRPAGLYFVRVRAGSAEWTRRIVLAN